MTSQDFTKKVMFVKIQVYVCCFANQTACQTGNKIKNSTENFLPTYSFYFWVCFCTFLTLHADLYFPLQFLNESNIRNEHLVEIQVIKLGMPIRFELSNILKYWPASHFPMPIIIDFNVIFLPSQVFIASRLCLTGVEPATLALAVLLHVRQRPQVSARSIP